MNNKGAVSVLYDLQLTDSTERLIWRKLTLFSLLLTKKLSETITYETNPWI